MDKMAMLHMVLVLVAKKGLKMVQMDIKSAFFYGDLNKEIYIELPESYWGSW